MANNIINQSVISIPPPSEIVFIDAAVPDPVGLLSGIAANALVVRLDAGQDGVTQITSVLEKHQNISAIHILSHGAPGQLQLGSRHLSLDNLSAYSTALFSWRDALTPDADLLLYGCDVAQGEGGSRFVQALSQLTGADVAASMNATGNMALGGDWILEDKTGLIEYPIILAEEEIDRYHGLLSVAGDMDLTFGDGNGYLILSSHRTDVTVQIRNKGAKP
ncbi:MAG: DUF4347 domain-containing protein [Magnetococcales bacterium]|nr:DUF4347 domain-containing protein [Magnetococcales bacterium]